MLKIILATFLVLSSQLSIAEWKQITLLSSEGINIHIDYEVKPGAINCYKCTRYTYAEPLYINIQHSGLHPSDQVRVVLMNNANSSYSSQERRVLDLHHVAGETFSIELAPLIIKTDNYGWMNDYHQELAVVINGKWLKDSINGTSNFKFQLK